MLDVLEIGYKDFDQNFKALSLAIERKNPQEYLTELTAEILSNMPLSLHRQDVIIPDIVDDSNINNLGHKKFEVMPDEKLKESFNEEEKK